MKVFTDAQVCEIKHLIIEIEKGSNRHTIFCAEKIRDILLQAEQVALKLEC